MLIQFFILRSWRGSFGARRASHCLFLYSRSRALKSPTQLRRWGVRLFLLQCKTALLVIVSIPVLLNWVWEKYGPMRMMMKQRRKKLLPDYYFSRAIKWKPSFLGFCFFLCCVTKLWFFTSWLAAAERIGGFFITASSWWNNVENYRHIIHCRVITLTQYFWDNVDDASLPPPPKPKASSALWEYSRPCQNQG